MITAEKPALNEDLLVHFGIKGMKWGIRKDRSSSPAPQKSGKNQPRFSEEQKRRAKQVAIGVGVLLVAAGSIYAIRSLNKSGGLPVKSVRPSSTAKKAVEEVFQPPTSVLHAARGKNVGFNFLQKGGTPTFLHAYEKAGFTAHGGGEMFRRAADGQVAARFMDPLKRSDWTGRAISHEVIVPKALASGINSVEDVKSKLWPTLKDAYDTFYQK